MKNKPLTYWLPAILLVLSLLTGCAGGGQRPLPATATPTLSAATPTFSLDQSMQTAMENTIPDVSSMSIQDADRTEKGMLAFVRDQRGVRATLGEQADAVFQKMDAAESEAVAKMLTMLQSQSTKGGNGHLHFALLLLSRNTDILTVPDRAELTPAATIYGLLLTAPDLFGKLMNKGLDQQKIPPLEVNDTSKEGVTTHIVLHPVVNGSRLEVEVELTLDFAGPPAFHESIKGKLSVNLCPDADGNVPLKVDLSNGYSTGGSGNQFTNSIQGTGHVNDNGELAGMDIQSLSGVGVQAKGDGNSSQYAEMKSGYSLVGIEQGGKPEFTNHQAEWTRQSSQVTPEFAQTATETIWKMIETLPIMAFKSAEEKWTNGFCLEVLAPDLKGDTNEVSPGSSTPFTAKVRHKFEDTELRVPVTASLSQGKEKVAPTGVKVPAPAAFTYAAPTEVKATAKVNLETRSKRGIAQLELTFQVQAQVYQLEFDSLFDITDEHWEFGALTARQHVHAVVPLAWSVEDKAYKGEGPLTYLEFSVSPLIAGGGDGNYYVPCPNKTSAKGSTLRVLSLTGIGGGTSSQPGANPASAIKLVIDPGATTEEADPICPPPFDDIYNESNTYNNWFAPTWSGNFLLIHGLESHLGSAPFTIQDWSAGSGDYLAKKVYQGTNDAASVLNTKELTTLILR